LVIDVPGGPQRPVPIHGRTVNNGEKVLAGIGGDSIIGSQAQGWCANSRNIEVELTLSR
jgi:hypothetical protein